MKKLIAIASLLLTSSLMASPWYLIDGNYQGKGVWKDSKGATGKYESTLTLKENTETRSQYGEITMAGSTKATQGEEIVHEERSTQAWRFTGWGRFMVLEGDKIIGQGRCGMLRCKYSYNINKQCGGETMRFYPKKGMIKVSGHWCDEESKGAYKGYLCKNCGE